LPPTRATRQLFWREFAMTATYGAQADGTVEFNPDRWLATLSK